MAITTQFSICQTGTCDSLIFNDVTGPYSITNTSGYGTPNESISGATAELIVTLADGTITTISLTAAGFPTTDKTLEYIITAEALGYSSGSKIADQLISFTYKVTTALTTIITQYKTQGFYCQVNCCVNSMFIDLDINCEDCMKSLGDRAMKAYIMLQGLKYSANCGDSTTFTKTLAQLNKLCLNSSCSNCNN